jgi:hypothetical protein
VQNTSHSQFIYGKKTQNSHFAKELVNQVQDGEIERKQVPHGVLECPTLENSAVPWLQIETGPVH